MEHEILDAYPGAQLRFRRRSLEISQCHLAEFSGIGQTVISRIEAGADARWSTLKRLFNAVGREIVVADEPYGEDDLQDFLRHGIRLREDAMEAGRKARW
jgi:transcriptional regulator with XRE-family HTH domain